MPDNQQESANALNRSTLRSLSNSRQRRHDSEGLRSLPQIGRWPDENDKVIKAINMLFQGVSRRKISRMLHIKSDTILTMLKKEAMHPEYLNHILIREFGIPQNELDDFWENIKNGFLRIWQIKKRRMKEYTNRKSQGKLLHSNRPLIDLADYLWDDDRVVYSHILEQYKMIFRYNRLKDWMQKLNDFEGPLNDLEALLKRIEGVLKKIQRKLDKLTRNKICGFFVDERKWYRLRFYRSLDRLKKNGFLTISDRIIRINISQIERIYGAVNGPIKGIKLKTDLWYLEWNKIKNGAKPGWCLRLKRRGKRKMKRIIKLHPPSSRPEYQRTTS